MATSPLPAVGAAAVPSTRHVDDEISASVGRDVHGVASSALDLNPAVSKRGLATRNLCVALSLQSRGPSTATTPHDSASMLGAAFEFAARQLDRELRTGAAPGGVAAATALPMSLRHDHAAAPPPATMSTAPSSSNALLDALEAELDAVESEATVFGSNEMAYPLLLTSLDAVDVNDWPTPPPTPVATARAAAAVTKPAPATMTAAVGGRRPSTTTINSRAGVRMKPLPSLLQPLPSAPVTAAPASGMQHRAGARHVPSAITLSTLTGRPSTTSMLTLMPPCASATSLPGVKSPQRRLSTCSISQSTLAPVAMGGLAVASRRASRPDLAATSMAGSGTFAPMTAPQPATSSFNSSPVDEAVPYARLLLMWDRREVMSPNQLEGWLHEQVAQWSHSVVHATHPYTPPARVQVPIPTTVPPAAVDMVGPAAMLLVDGGPEQLADGGASPMLSALTLPTRAQAAALPASLRQLAIMLASPAGADAPATTLLLPSPAGSPRPDHVPLVSHVMEACVRRLAYCDSLLGVYDLAFAELTRQGALACVEQGELTLEMWVTGRASLWRQVLHAMSGAQLARVSFEVTRAECAAAVVGQADADAHFAMLATVLDASLQRLRAAGLINEAAAYAWAFRRVSSRRREERGRTRPGSEDTATTAEMATEATAMGQALLKTMRQADALLAARSQQAASARTARLVGGATIPTFGMASTATGVHTMGVDGLEMLLQALERETLAERDGLGHGPTSSGRGGWMVDGGTPSLGQLYGSTLTRVAIARVASQLAVEGDTDADDTASTRSSTSSSSRDRWEEVEGVPAIGFAAGRKASGGRRGSRRRSQSSLDFRFDDGGDHIIVTQQVTEEAVGVVTSPSPALPMQHRRGGGKARYDWDRDLDAEIDAQVMTAREDEEEAGEGAGGTAAHRRSGSQSSGTVDDSGDDDGTPRPPVEGAATARSQPSVTDPSTAAAVERFRLRSLTSTSLSNSAHGASATSLTLLPDTAATATDLYQAVVQEQEARRKLSSRGSASSGTGGDEGHGEGGGKGGGGGLVPALKRMPSDADFIASLPPGTNPFGLQRPPSLFHISTARSTSRRDRDMKVTFSGTLQTIPSLLHAHDEAGAAGGEDATAGEAGQGAIMQGAVEEEGGGASPPSLPPRGPRKKRKGMGKSGKAKGSSPAPKSKRPSKAASLDSGAGAVTVDGEYIGSRRGSGVRATGIADDGSDAGGEGEWEGDGGEGEGVDAAGLEQVLSVALGTTSRYQLQCDVADLRLKVMAMHGVLERMREEAGYLSKGVQVGTSVTGAAVAAKKAAALRRASLVEQARAAQASNAKGHSSRSSSLPDIHAPDARDGHGPGENDGSATQGGDAGGGKKSSGGGKREGGGGGGKGARSRRRSVAAIPSSPADGKRVGGASGGRRNSAGHAAASGQGREVGGGEEDEPLPPLLPVIDPIDLAANVAEAVAAAQAAAVAAGEDPSLVPVEEVARSVHTRMMMQAAAEQGIPYTPPPRHIHASAGDAEEPPRGTSGKRGHRGGRRGSQGSMGGRGRRRRSSANAMAAPPTPTDTARSDASGADTADEVRTDEEGGDDGASPDAMASHGVDGGGRDDTAGRIASLDEGMGGEITSEDAQVHASNGAVPPSRRRRGSRARSSSGGGTVDAGDGEGSGEGGGRRSRPGRARGSVASASDKPRRRASGQAPLNTTDAEVAGWEVDGSSDVEGDTDSVREGKASTLAPHDHDGESAPHGRAGRRRSSVRSTSSTHGGGDGALRRSSVSSQATARSNVTRASRRMPARQTQSGQVDAPPTAGKDSSTSEHAPARDAGVPRWQGERPGHRRPSAASGATTTAGHGEEEPPRSAASRRGSTSSVSKRAAGLNTTRVGGVGEVNPVAPLAPWATSTNQGDSRSRADGDALPTTAQAHPRRSHHRQAREAGSDSDGVGGDAGTHDDDALSPTTAAGARRAVFPGKGSDARSARHAHASPHSDRHAVPHAATGMGVEEGEWRVSADTPGMGHTDRDRTATHRSDRGHVNGGGHGRRRSSTGGTHVTGIPTVTPKPTTVPVSPRIGMGFRRAASNQSGVGGDWVGASASETEAEAVASDAAAVEEERQERMRRRSARYRRSSITLQDRMPQFTTPKDVRLRVLDRAKARAARSGGGAGASTSLRSGAMTGREGGMVGWIGASNNDAKLTRSRQRVARLVARLGLGGEGRSAREPSLPLRWALMVINGLYSEKEMLLRSLLATQLGPSVVTPLTAVAAALLAGRSTASKPAGSMLAGVHRTASTGALVPSYSMHGGGSYPHRPSTGDGEVRPVSAGLSGLAMGTTPVRRGSFHAAPTVPTLPLPTHASNAPSGTGQPDTARRGGEGGADDREGRKEQEAQVARELLAEAVDPASPLISGGRFDYFLADSFARKFGLDALARKHMATLLRCARAFRTDSRIALFIRFLANRHTASDFLFFLTVRALCRAGVPRDAWSTAGLPVGGHAHVKAQEWWAVLWAAVVMRRAVQRWVQRRRGAGTGAVVDLVRARRTVRSALTSGVLLVSGGDHDPVSASYATSRRHGGPSLTISPHAELIVTCACAFTPRTARSMSACTIAAASMPARTAFPFLRAAAALTTAIHAAPDGMPLHLLSGSSRISVAAGGWGVPTQGMLHRMQSGVGWGASSTTSRMLASASGGRGVGAVEGGTVPGGLALPLPLPPGPPGIPQPLLRRASATAASPPPPGDATPSQPHSAATTRRASYGDVFAVGALSQPPGPAAQSYRLAPIGRGQGPAMANEGHGLSLSITGSVAGVVTQRGGGMGATSRTTLPPSASPSLPPATAHHTHTGRQPSMLRMAPLSSAMPLHPLFRQGALPPLREGDISASPSCDEVVEQRRRMSLPTPIITARSGRPQSAAPVASHDVGGGDGPGAAVSADAGSGALPPRPWTQGSSSSLSADRSSSRGGRRPSLPSHFKTADVAMASIPTLDLRGRRGSVGEGEASQVGGGVGGLTSPTATTGRGGGDGSSAVLSPTSASATWSLTRSPRSSHQVGGGRRRPFSAHSMPSAREVLQPMPGVPVQSRREMEGVTAYTLWSPSRLVKLFLMVPGEGEAKGVFLRSTPANVTFPDSVDGVPGMAQGHPQWVSLRRAREIVRLMLMAHEQEEAMAILSQVAEWGLPPQYAVAVEKWPRHIAKLMEVTGRVDRDVLAALLVTIRERARLEFAEDLAIDFAAFDTSRRGAMKHADFTSAMRNLFPHTFTQGAVDALYDRGRVLEARMRSAMEGGREGGRHGDDLAALPITAWHETMFVDHLLELSENLLH